MGLGVYYNRKTGQAIVVGPGFDDVAAEMLSKLPPEIRDQFEQLSLPGVVYLRAVDKGHLLLTSVPDGTM